jgi:hypothetical protein
LSGPKPAAPTTGAEIAAALERVGLERGGKRASRSSPAVLSHNAVASLVGLYGDLLAVALDRADAAEREVARLKLIVEQLGGGRK